MLGFSKKFSSLSLWHFVLLTYRAKNLHLLVNKLSKIKAIFERCLCPSFERQATVIAWTEQGANGHYLCYLD